MDISELAEAVLSWCLTLGSHCGSVCSPLPPHLFCCSPALRVTTLDCTVAARAMLMKADIFLLDEPTNHLDVTNVAWLERYLNSLPDVTSMIVSHDSGFLDNVCTDIIHYEQHKLKNYKVSATFPDNR